MDSVDWVFMVLLAVGALMIFIFWFAGYFGSNDEPEILHYVYSKNLPSFYGLRGTKKDEIKVYSLVDYDTYEQRFIHVGEELEKDGYTLVHIQYR